MILLSGLFWFCTLATYAQLYLGVKGGPNLSNLLIGSDQQVFANDFYQYKVGYQVGIIAQARFSEGFYIQPELLWVVKGSSVLTNAAINERENFNLSYISLPLIAVFRVGESLGITFGPELAYLASSRIGDQNLGNLLTFKDFDLSLDAGALLDLSNALFIDVRFSFGVFNIERFGLAGASGSTATRNASMQVSLGYMLSQD